MKRRDFLKLLGLAAISPGILVDVAKSMPISTQIYRYRYDDHDFYCSSGKDWKKMYQTYGRYYTAGTR